MTSERLRKLHARLGPLVWLEAALGVSAMLSLFLGPKGIGNPWFLLLACLGAVANALRNVALYRLMDEYERSLMLRALAAAFIFLMFAVFVTAMVGALSVTEAVSPLLLMGLFLAAWVVFAVAHAVLQRREAQE